MVCEFVECHFSILWFCDLHRDLDLKQFAHLHTYIDNVAKFGGNWIRNYGRKPSDKICEWTDERCLIVWPTLYSSLQDFYYLS